MNEQNKDQKYLHFWKGRNLDEMSREEAISALIECATHLQEALQRNVDIHGIYLNRNNQ